MLLVMMAEDSITWLDVYYVDIIGRGRVITVPYEKLSSNGEICFDGSSVNIVGVEDSDLMLIPDRRTLRKLPWDAKRGIIIADITVHGAKDFWGNTRGVAEKTSNYLRRLGYQELIGVELEFFIHKVKVEITPRRQLLEIIHDGKSPESIFLPKYSYHTINELDIVSHIRRSIVDALSKMGVRISSTHHEVAVNQVEISFEPSNCLGIADEISILKYTAKAITKRYGYQANFMPKPLWGDNGSGMHIHVSITCNGRNLFYDEEEHISQIGRYFIGGLIEHGRALAALVAPTVNSYRRLMPGYEAPIYLTWGFANRSVAIRVPRTNSPSRVRIEFRMPDPLANPYLAIPATILAGLDGVRRKIEPGEPLNINVYKLSESEVKHRGMKTVPKSLDEALEELESDHEFLKPIFSETLISKYIELKREEIRKIEAYPTPIEYLLYLQY